MSQRDASTISPTAHYTGHVWYRHGLSHPVFATREGAAMYHALRPLNAMSALLGGSDLETLLLARHGTIDARLRRAIEGGEIGQVVEVACGLSPRGQRFSERYGRDLLYLEGDLPEMAARKRAVLERAGAALGDRHDVVSIDAFAEEGPQSLAVLAEERLDPSLGTALVTEGLTSYFDPPDLIRMWRGFTRVLSRFPRGLYFADFHFEEDARRLLWSEPFRRFLAAFARIRRPAYFADEGAARRGLDEAGFSSASFSFAGEERGVDPRRSAWVRIVEARV